MKSIRSFLAASLISIAFSKEVSYKDIPLSGLITNPKQEISGMDWYGDNLILLPENLGGFLYMIPKTDLQTSLNSENPKPIEPLQPSFNTPDYSISIPGFEGLEAIAFKGNDVFITLEAKDGKTMHGYLAWGTIDPTTRAVIIPEENLLELATPIQVKNMTFESLLIRGNNIILFYEVNGANLLMPVWQYIISLKDFSQSKIAHPNIEYRITDVTRLDSQNRFWTINYHWPGDTKRVKPAPDPIALTFGEGESHKNAEGVERLIELEIHDNKIQHSGRKPIQLVLDDENSRNWEGIVRLDEKGFLIATDKYPGMILGFVPFE